MVASIVGPCPRTSSSCRSVSRFTDQRVRWKLDTKVLDSIRDGGRGRNRTAIVGHSCTLARSPLVTDPDSGRGGAAVGRAA